MASVTDENVSHRMGLHEEALTGRSRDVFFDSEEDQNYLYDWADSVNFDNMAEVDAEHLSASEFSLRVQELMEEGIGTIVVHNPGAKHSLGVGILSRLNLRFEGSLGYFGLGCLDGPNVQISGRVAGPAQRTCSRAPWWWRRTLAPASGQLSEAATSSVRAMWARGQAST